MPNTDSALGRYLDLKNRKKKNAEPILKHVALMLVASEAAWSVRSTRAGA